MFGLGPSWVVAAVFAIVFAGGFVAGVTGFGQALVSTATLAVLLAPQQAVVIMILPLLAANVSLVTELDAEQFRSCLSRFYPYVVAALAGTGLGMVLLRQLPSAPLALALGLFTLGYVLFKQDRVSLPGKQWLADRCFRDSLTAKIGLGFVSGGVFGATNLGVQVVAYLDSLDLDRSTFVGVLAMILVGISAVRVGMAFLLGLYGSTGFLTASAIAAIPALLGVGAGKHVRDLIPSRYETAGVLLLLLAIGLKLSYSGLRGLI